MLSRKDLVATLRGTLSSLAQWSAGWGSGLLIPPGVEGRLLGATVRACGESITIRHIVDEMWAAEQTFDHHAGSANYKAGLIGSRDCGNFSNCTLRQRIWNRIIGREISSDAP